MKSKEAKIQPKEEYVKDRLPIEVLENEGGPPPEIALQKQQKKIQLNKAG